MVAPNVTVLINNQSIYAEPNPTTIPLFVFATRTGKLASDGSGTAQGTIESNKLRVVTSQRELTLNYGDPVFVTSAGDPVHGEETNEYGLNAAYNFLAQVDQAYIVRADIDLGDLVATQTEPAFPAPDGTYWIEQSAVIGGIFKWDGASYTTMPFSVFVSPPTASEGNDGDWAFDYSDDNGTMMFKHGGNWHIATDDNLTNQLGSATLTIAPTSPVVPTVGDFWYKTTSGAGGTNLKLASYRAVDGRWVYQIVHRDMVPPVPSEGIVWEDVSQIGNTGHRPLMIGTGTEFISLEVFVQDKQPTTDPDTGTLWYDDTLTDFALYVEGGAAGGSFGNQWVPVETTTVSNPSPTQKVISASPPRFPQQSSVWVDLSTPENIDNFPVIKRFVGSDWVDITDSVLIQPEDPNATLVLNGTYWLNNGEAKTRNTIKRYNPTFQPLTVKFDGTSYVVENELDNFWEPDAGDTFGRKSQREVVVESLQSAINMNQDIRNDVIYFQLIACPGYPELYDEMISLNNDNGETAFVVSDPSKFMIPSGIPEGREVSAAEWITNANNVISTGEDGFASSPSVFAGVWYPWGISSDINGDDVFVPPSHAVLRMIGRSDQISAPWFPPAGFNRGIVDSFASVGHLKNDGSYNPLMMTQSQLNILYDNKINPITFKPNRGLVAWGQKTLSASASALDRVNVARLIAKMKYDLKVMMEPFLF
ncbi:MAG: hypothetical protein DRQ35_06905, partial [Gammaproteobacteria bacterium]